MVEVQVLYLDSALAAGNVPDDSSAPPVIDLGHRSPWKWSDYSDDAECLRK